MAAAAVQAPADALVDEGGVPVPPQYKPQPLYDFRQFPEEARGFKVGVTKLGRLGTKRKLDEYAEQVEREQAEMEEKSPAELAAAVAVAAAPLAKRAKHNTLGVGKASGRDWKVPAQRAGTLRNPKLSTSWEKKMANKAEADAFKGRKRAAKAAKGEAAAAERQRREAAKKKKEEARAKAAVVTRVSAATAKRMMKSKKGRKQLRTGDA
ncbi:coiled-coil domain-containing 86 [Micractinium conductrix]|uniref:Coiled-coil domain-containing protein 86 n=1 Tax=Micractinium conductrix TaxID=554055 RepID=A0A2P6VC13_9CHLO|nr:coiled-coil domain-containing 86 [Micractinium conductrix]|eukprot:PSC71626.1 coiled-coil domain-containing 86 [Micractinium conductrix]